MARQLALPKYFATKIFKKCIDILYRVWYNMTVIKRAAGCFTLKGGDSMVTYEALFAFVILIVAIIDLCLTHKKK